MYNWTLPTIETLDNPYKDKRRIKIIKKRNSMRTENPKSSSIYKAVKKVEGYKLLSKSFSKKDESANNTIKHKYYIHMVNKKNKEKRNDFSVRLHKLMKLYDYYKVFSKPYLLRNPIERNVAEELVKEYFPYYSNNKAKLLANLFIIEKFPQPTTSILMQIQIVQTNFEGNRKLLILIKGTIEIRRLNGKVICQLNQGQMYNDSFIIDKPLVTLYATNDVHCISLMWSEFNKFLKVLFNI